MKEISKKIISILVVMLLLINSSFLTIISTAIDELANSTEKVNIETNVEKFVSYEFNDKKGVLAKINVKAKIEYEEGQEAETTKVELQMPQIKGEYPENIELIENSVKIQNYEYDKQSGKLVVYVNNESKEEFDFSVDMYFGADCYGENLEYNGTTIEEQISGLVSTNITTNDIYNGYIKSNAQNGTKYKTEYTENLEIKFDYKEISDEIEIKETDEVKAEDIIYKSISLNKNNILDILGENGTLKIQNESGEDLLEINKDTASEEDGTIKFDYNKDVKGLTIKTSKPEKVGIIKIENKKAINETMVDLSATTIKTETKINCINNVEVEPTETEETENTEEIETEQKIVYNFSDNKETQIKGTETKVDLSMDKKALIANSLNQVNFTATLVSNDAKYSLFKNPVIEIKLPAEVEKVTLGNIFVLYDNAFSVIDQVVTEEGDCKVIRITLSGAQNSYVSSNVYAGPEVLIPATLTVNKDVASNQNAVVSVKCTNNNVIAEYSNQDYNVAINSIQVMSLDEETESDADNSEEQPEVVEDYSGLTSSITATIGDKALTEGEAVYEYEYIKYNVTLKNTSKTKMQNINVVGNVPEGTVYVNAYFDESKAINNYIIENDYEKTEFNETVSLNAGEEKQISYTIKVLDFEETATEKNITEKNMQSDIKISARNKVINEYTLNNVAKKAEMKLKLQSWETLRDDNLWLYKMVVTNKTENDISNAIIDMGLQKEMKFNYIDSEGNGYSVNETVNGLRVNVPELKANEEKEIWLFIQMARTDENILNFEPETFATVKGDDTKTYYSNINKARVYTAGIEVTQTSAKGGKELQYDEEVEYNFVIKNVSNENILKNRLSLELMNFTDKNLVPISADYEYWEYEYNEENNTYKNIKKTKTVDIPKKIVPTGVDESTVADLDIILSIPAGEEVNVTLKLKAGKVTAKTEVSNSIKVSYEYCGEHVVTSNVIKNTILPVVNPDDDSNNDSGDEPDDDLFKYSIGGFAWKDSNKNGKFDDGEEKLSGITVKLFNAETNSIVKDENGNNLYATTDNEGKYVFEDVSIGKYLVLFEYDVDNYSVTTYKKELVSDDVNSDVVVKEVSIDGVEKTVAVTDILELEDANKLYINMGLVEKEKFDLSLDKSITKITVKYDGFYKEYDYKETKLAKVDIPAKKMQGAQIQVDYQIKVTNEGNVKGYVNEVADYLPDGFEFDNGLNNDWKYENGILKNTSNSGITLDVGQSKVFTLHLTRTLDENSTGKYENSAEILNSNSVNGTTDIDSTNGNKVTTEDDYSKAELLISIKTGAVTYIGIILLLIGVLIVLKVLMDKKIINIKGLKIFSVVFVLMFIMFGCNSSKAASVVKVNEKGEIVNVLNENEQIKILKEKLKNDYTVQKATNQIKYGQKEFYMEKKEKIGQSAFKNILKNIIDNEDCIDTQEEAIKFHVWNMEKEDGILEDTNKQLYSLKISHGYAHHDRKPVPDEKFYCSDGLYMAIFPEKWVYEYKYVTIGEDVFQYTETKKENLATISDNNSNPEFIAGDSYYLVGPYNIEFNGSIYDVNVTTASGKNISDFAITNQKGTNKNIKSGESFYIKINKNYKEINVNVKVLQRNSKITYNNIQYDCVETWKTNHEDAQVLKRKFTKKGNKEIYVDTCDEITLPGASTKGGNLKIIKVDMDTEKPLPGARFKILDSNKKAIDNIIYKTGTDGTVTISGIDPGIYYVQETEAPSGYELKTELTKVTITENKTTPIQIYNINTSSTASVSILKVDSRDPSIPLANVGFQLTTKIKILVKQEGEKKLKTEDIYSDVYYYYYDKKVKKYGKDPTGKNQKYEIVDLNNKNSQGYKIYMENPDARGREKTGTEKKEYQVYKYQEVTHYLKSDGTWTTNKTTIYTNKNGRIEIEKIIKPETVLPAYSYYTDQNGKNGKYIKSSKTLGQEYAYYTELARENMPRIKVKETDNKNYGYKYNVGRIDETITNSDTLKIKNIQKYVKISGYVWLDATSGKISTKDNKYTKGESGVNGITVYLKNNGKTVASTTTDERGLYDINGGEYQFEEVPLYGLEQNLYYIEFVYHGITYQAVDVYNLNEENYSKAAENNSRQTLNSKFSSVDGNGTQNLNINGVKVNYAKGTYKSSISEISGDEVTASTAEAGYELLRDWSPTQAEIKNINLGLYERPQIDLALGQDLEEITVKSNGKEHIYTYGQRPYANENENIYKEQTQTYTRDIYKADAGYGEKNQGQFEIKLTYKIRLLNQSENGYTVKINNLLNYYNKEYEIVAIGENWDKDSNTVLNTIDRNPNVGEVNRYKKSIIYINTTMGPNEQSKDFYIQYSINAANTLSLLNSGNINLYPVAEINSYTTYSNGGVVAAVDVDSVPGNATPGNISSYEDDTEAAPIVQLKETDSVRTLNGTVFLDWTTGELRTGETRQADGIYDERIDIPLKGIQVELIDLDRNQTGYIYSDSGLQEAKTTTDDQGNYYFNGLVAGNYVVRFTWGDSTYKVQYYKGTIYEKDGREDDVYWYRRADNTRRTDAIDNYAIRQEIDNETANVTDNTLATRIENAYNGHDDKITKTKMQSNTPTMAFGVEFNDNNYNNIVISNGVDNQKITETFKIENVDFGIVERARQQMDISKRVKYFKITLSNGQVLAEANIDANGKVNGELNYVTYQPSSINNGIKSNGFIKAEVDKEIIENANLLIKYEIVVTNNSEKDYYTYDYYAYGTIPGEDKVITLRPSTIIEYSDSEMILNNNNSWNLTNTTEIRNLNAHYATDSEFLKGRTLYANTGMGEFKPTESQTMEIEASKLLTSTDDYTFDNDVEIATINKPVTDDQKGSVAKFSINGVAVDAAEKAIIIPPTGDNESYTQIVIISVISLAILSTGIVLIKKFVIG